MPNLWDLLDVLEVLDVFDGSGYILNLLTIWIVDTAECAGKHSCLRAKTKEVGSGGYQNHIYAYTYVHMYIYTQRER